MSDGLALRRLSVLLLTVFVDMVGLLMIVPVLPLYAKDLGASGLVVGLLFASFSFAQLVTSALWGKLSDRYGRRPVLLVALLASAVAYAIFGFADSLWLLFVMRFVQGAGGGTTGVVQAYVSDTVTPARRAEALGWVSSATNVGVVIGPVIGAGAARFGPQTVGFVAAGLCLLNVVSAWIWLPESRVSHVEQNRPSLHHAVRQVLMHPFRPVSALIWIYTLAMMAFLAMNAVLALFLGARFGVTQHTIFWFFVYVGTISVVMRTLILGPAVRRLGERGTMRLGFIALTLGLVALPFPMHVWGFALAVLFVPIGTALLFPPTSSLVSRFTPAAEVGQTLGVQQAFGGVARLIGPVWAGWVFDHVSIGAPFWLGGGLLAATSLFLRPLGRAESPPAGAPAAMPPAVEVGEVVDSGAAGPGGS